MLIVVDKNNIVMHDHYPLIIFLMGPTASGKTSLAIALKQKQLNIQIISVDSALVYKGMNIGTSKPLLSELQYAPHKLVDIRDPSECYSVANFYYDVIIEINKILKSGSIPLLVGGTMLYFKVLLEGLFNLPKTNQKIRDTLEHEAQKIGWINMYKKLQHIDPIGSNKIHWNDRKRIIRALEVFLISGISWTQLKTQDNYQPLKYQVLQFAIMPSNHQILCNRIAQRFYQMLKIGFEDEVNILFNRSDLHQGSKSSILCVGYRQMWQYLSGTIQYNDMVCSSISSTRRIAKKQLTWLRRWPNLFWLNGDHTSSAMNTMLEVLSKIKLPNVYHI